MKGNYSRRGKNTLPTGIYVDWNTNPGRPQQVPVPIEYKRTRYKNIKRVIPGTKLG